MMLCGPATEMPREDLQKLLVSARVMIYYSDGPDFKLVPP
jgi:hypothetical protein